METYYIQYCIYYLIFILENYLIHFERKPIKPNISIYDRKVVPKNVSMVRMMEFTINIEN